SGDSLRAFCPSGHKLVASPRHPGHHLQHAALLLATQPSVPGGSESCHWVSCCYSPADGGLVNLVPLQGGFSSGLCSSRWKLSVRAAGTLPRRSPTPD